MVKASITLTAAAFILAMSISAHAGSLFSGPVRETNDVSIPQDLECDMVNVCNSKLTGVVVTLHVLNNTPQTFSNNCGIVPAHGECQMSIGTLLQPPVKPVYCQVTFNDDAASSCVRALMEVLDNNTGVFTIAVPVN